MTKVHNPGVGMAAIALSIASLAVSGSIGSVASAATLASTSKFCQQVRADESRHDYTGQTAVNSYKKLAKIAPAGIKRDLNTLAQNVQSVLNKGSVTNSREQFIQKEGNKVLAELNSKCG